MAEVMESRMKIMWIALTALIAVIPIVKMLARRRQGIGMSKEGALLEESKLEETTA